MIYVDVDTVKPDQKLYAIMRIAKVRTFATLGHVSAHNNRDMYCENVDEEGPPPFELLGAEGSDDFVTSAKARLTELGIDKASVSKKVLAVEAVTSASKRWFEEASQSDKDEWLSANVKWGREKFGRGLLSVKHHLDEETWHLHFVALPVVEKPKLRRGRPPTNPEARAKYDADRLNAPMVWTLAYEDMFGGYGSELSREQDDYHACVSHLGLERGEKDPKETDLQLGDELTISRSDWERITGGRNLPPSKYRKLLRQMGREIAAERELVRRDRREAAKNKVAALLDAQEAKLDKEAAARLFARAEAAYNAVAAREGAAEARENAVAPREANATKRESALVANEATYAANNASLSTSRDLVDDLVTKLTAKHELADTVAAAQARLKSDLDSRKFTLDGRDAVIEGTEAQAKLNLAEAERVLADANTKLFNVESKEREVADRELAANVSTAQIRLLARALVEPVLELRNDENSVTMSDAAMNPAEVEAYRSPWSAFMADARRLIADMLKAFREAREKLLKWEGKLIARETALQTRLDYVLRKEPTIALLDEREQTVREREHSVDESTTTLNRRAAQLEIVERIAENFRKAWEAIPADERSPINLTAEQMAQNLANAIAQTNAMGRNNR